jgi:hypothetical protein
MHQQGRDKLLQSIDVDHDSCSECWTGCCAGLSVEAHAMPLGGLATAHTVTRVTHMLTGECAPPTLGYHSCYIHAVILL